MKKLIALDTATKRSGTAVFENGVLAGYGACTVDTSLPLQQRTEAMMECLYMCITEHHPDIVVAEMMVVPNNEEVQRALTEIVGAVRFMCLSQGIEFHELRPAEWRKLVCNPGEKAPYTRHKAKPWSIAKVKELYGRDVDDDISDAILIGRAYLNQQEQG